MLMIRVSITLIHTEQAYGTTDVRLVDSHYHSYVLQFGHVIDDPTLWGYRQWHCL